MEPTPRCVTSGTLLEATHASKSSSFDANDETTIAFGLPRTMFVMVMCRRPVHRS